MDAKQLVTKKTKTVSIEEVKLGKNYIKGHYIYQRICYLSFVYDTFDKKTRSTKTTKAQLSETNKNSTPSSPKNTKMGHEII